VVQKAWEHFTLSLDLHFEGLEARQTRQELCLRVLVGIEGDRRKDSIQLRSIFD
jgi:hypothetical protein